MTGLLRTASELFCFLTTLDVEPKKRSPPKVSSTNGAFGVPCSIAGEHFITTDPNERLPRTSHSVPMASLRANGAVFTPITS